MPTLKELRNKDVREEFLNNITENCKERQFKEIRIQAHLLLDMILNYVSPIKKGKVEIKTPILTKSEIDNMLKGIEEDE